MHNIEEYREAGEEIYHKLHLGSFPVAIKYIQSLDDIPDYVIRPKNKGRKMSICQGFHQSRRFGETIAVTVEDNFCTPATLAHGWIDLSKEEFIESQLRQQWQKDEKAQRKRVEKMFATQFSMVRSMGYCGMISSPLNKTKVIPDTVLIFGDGPQMTQIIHALSYEKKKKYRVESSFEGFGESCGKGGLLPHIMKRAQLVLPGMGDRSFAGIQDHELAIGMPGDYIFYVNEHMFQTGKSRGMGMPVKHLIPMSLTASLTPGFEYLQELIDKKLAENKK
ncbi:MAG: DUF169 domain-containing protein [archaeon]|nr:DUF169 domain-containing protein [archaeon]